MPVYEVTSPDGKRWEVSAPDGASMDDVLAYAKRQWGAPQKQEQASPADGIGAFEAGLIGAGRTTDKLIAGAKQVLANFMGDQQELERLAAAQTENDRLYKPLQSAHPVATGVGEAVPALAVPVGGGAGLGMVARSALAGAAPGALSYGSLEERAKGGLLGAAGGAVGGGMGLALGKILRPASKAASISPEATDAAERLGMSLSAGQRTQNPALMNFENYLLRSPGSSGAMQARGAANQAAVNRAAAKAMGQTADTLDEGVFSTARNAIGAEFQRLEAMTQPQLGQGFFKALADIDAANMARGAFRSPKIDGLVDKGLDLAAQNKLTGTAYKEIRTELSNKANEAFKGGDATLGQAYKTLREALDDAAKASLSKKDREAWDIAREQWAAFKTLSRSNVSEAGNVSPARVASALRQRGDQFRTGRMDGPVADIGRVGEAVKSTQNPNSGTLVNQMLYGNPLSGLPLMAGNKVAQSIYTSPLIQKYLANGLLDIGEAGQITLGKLALPTGLPAAQSFLGSQ